MQQSPFDQPPVKQFALFELGFRPFFLFASLFSIIVTVLWMANYSFGWSLPINNVIPIAWHGHEMVFGYGAAVVAGFLLTAVRNWTGVPTISGTPLILLVLAWLLARTLPFFNSPLLSDWAAIADLSFLIGFTLAVLHPIVKVRQWRQLLIVLVLLLLTIADIFYYLGIFHIVNQVV